MQYSDQEVSKFLVSRFSRSESIGVTSKFPSFQCPVSPVTTGSQVEGLEGPVGRLDSCWAGQLEGWIAGKLKS